MDAASKVQKPRFHSRDLRKGRLSRTGQIYLITTTTSRRRRIFLDYQAARRVVESLRYLDAAKRAKTLAFVVMPDHLHWLMQLSGREDLSSVMRSLKGYSGNQIRAGTGMSGRVWQTGFHDHAVRREEDIKALARYVVANPIRAGLAETIGDYPHWDAVWF